MRRPGSARVRSPLILAMALLLSGCVVSTGGSSTDSHQVTSTREVVLVDADFSLTPTQTSASFPYALGAAASASQLTLTKSGAGQPTFEGAGSCSGFGGNGNIQVDTGQDNQHSGPCGALPAGNQTLVVRSAAGGVSGHVKFTAQVPTG
ncbi:MAG: hypothetical protein QOE90_1961 [Thermoplasmata archaeon]|jgi:hypothetical protein|nr:hypothetical protein [Thermoplasmata archaeon]